MIKNTLITWRLTELFHDEEGPFDVFERLREYLSQASQSTENNRILRVCAGEILQAIECKWCLSVYCGFFVAKSTGKPLLYGLAYSAGSLIYDIMFKWLRRNLA